MPIYAYRCTTCGHAQDVLQKMSDDALTECPSCHASTYAKQVTAAGFQLKGSGWYVTDFRGGNTAAAKPDADAAKDGSKTSDKAGDKAGDSAGSTSNDKPAQAGAASASSATPAAAPAAPAPSPPAAASAAPAPRSST
jgi:putative FmdB family regulatory protein